ncbi:unnamed protein product, partial [Musa acuminata var. zebrina]
VGDDETIFHSHKNLNQQVACGCEDEKYKLANLHLFEQLVGHLVVLWTWQFSLYQSF